MHAVQDIRTRTAIDHWPDSVLQTTLVQDGYDATDTTLDASSLRSSVLGYAPQAAAMLPSPLLAAHELIGWEAEAAAEAEADCSSAMEVEAAIHATLLLPPSPSPPPPATPQQQQPWQRELAAQRQAAAQRQVLERQALGRQQALERQALEWQAAEQQGIGRQMSLGSTDSLRKLSICSNASLTALDAGSPFARRSLLRVHQGGASISGGGASGGCSRGFAAAATGFGAGLGAEPADDRWWIDDAPAAEAPRSVRAVSMSAATTGQAHASAAAAFGLQQKQQQRTTRRPSLPPLPKGKVRRSSFTADTASAGARSMHWMASSPQSGSGSSGHPAAAGTSQEALATLEQRPHSLPDWQRRPTWASEWAAQHIMRNTAGQGGFRATASGGNGGDAINRLVGRTGSFATGEAEGGGSGAAMDIISYLQQLERRYVHVGA